LVEELADPIFAEALSEAVARALGGQANAVRCVIGYHLFVAVAVRLVDGGETG
jgi:hypothetical protein